MIRRPKFWQKKLSAACLLLPLSAMWWVGSVLRQTTIKPYHARLPVICIGNLSVGGTGKTPTAILIAKLLKAQGYHPAILSRGYGGSLGGPCWVDKTIHTASDVGDEPLLLSNHLSVCVARNRAVGAQFIENTTAYDVILMDDGLQNPSLHKDLVIGVFDGGVGIGNGWLLPAGPMREPLTSGMDKLDLILINGKDETGLKSLIPQDKIVFEAELKPENAAQSLHGKPVIAFAGIGRPERFFSTAAQLGAKIIDQHAFADHHPFSVSELTKLYEVAQAAGAHLITTEKDWQRLPIDWQNKIANLPVALTMSESAKQTLSKYITDRVSHVIPS